MIGIFQYLQDTKGKKIPLEFKLINNLPLTKNDLIYNGNLDLWFSKITSLPDNLTVNGDVRLYGSNIISLPNNLTVNGYLSLYKSKINKLPNSLIVEFVLDIGHTKISTLPEDLYVAGDLWCNNTPLADKIKNDESLLNKYSKQIKGIIYLS